MTDNKVQIPDILKDCRFIIVKKGTKEPYEKKWQLENNYSIDDQKLMHALKTGYNYGVMPSGNVGILDADEPDILQELGLLEQFNDTFTVKSGGGEKYHYYFETDEGIGNTKIVLFHPETEEHLGEVYPPGCPAYCVGAGSVHPSGKLYIIFKDLPLKYIPSKDINSILEKCKKKGKQEQPKRDPIDWSKHEGSKDTLTNIVGLRIEDIAYPSGKVVINGDEIQGSHPIHGSTTGMNYSINTAKNLFHCWRCGTGGDPLVFMAMKEGLISCEDAGKGALTDSDTLKKLQDVILSGKYGKGYAEQLRKHNKESLQNWKEKQEKKKKKQQIDDETGLLVRDDTPLSITQLNLTDIGNALRFQALYGDKFRFDFSKNTWYYWNDEIWLLDNNGCAKKAAQYTIAKMADEIKVLYQQGDEKHAETVYKHMKKSSSERARSDMLKTVAPHMAVSPGVWNSKPELLNLLNGTLNLETFKLQEFHQEDFLTMKAGVRYDPGAKCTEWLEHLNLVFGNDKELISAFQLMAGYSLISGNPSQVFFIPYGSGKNGKSVTINTLRMIMGDYGIHVAPQSLMIQKNPDKARSDLVRIQYKRLVTSSEAEQGSKLDIGWIKQITGGEPIVARALYQNEIEFRVEAVIWFATNHKPIINEYNEAIWRRIWLIPFDQVIPEKKRIVDYERKLIESEGSGILNWMLEGLKRYYDAGGLIKPKAITDATEEYKEDEDPLGDYLKENTVIEPGAKVIDRDLYTDYGYWCANNGIKYCMSKNTFTRNLLDHPGITKGRTKSSRLYLGIRLKTDEDKKRESEEVTKETLEGFV